MSATSRIADELLLLADRVGSLGLGESSRQITIAAGLVLAEAGDMCGGAPAGRRPSGTARTDGGRDTVVPFRRAADAHHAALPRRNRS